MILRGNDMEIKKIEKPGDKPKKRKGKKLPIQREVPVVIHLPCVKCGIVGYSEWGHCSSDEKALFGGCLGDKVDDRIGAVLCNKPGSNWCHLHMDTPPSKEKALAHTALWYRLCLQSWLMIWDWEDL